MRYAKKHLTVIYNKKETNYANGVKEGVKTGENVQLLAAQAHLFILA